MTQPSMEDAGEFVDKVDELARLIEGLKSGTISPEYLDKKKLAEEVNNKNTYMFTIIDHTNTYLLSQCIDVNLN